jgi:hypothetical protein
MLFNLGRTHSSDSDDNPIQWIRDFRRIVAVDPGLQGTGVAIFENGIPTQSRVLMVRGKLAKDDWTVRADYLAGELSYHTGSTYESTVVLCEMPEFQAGAARSMGWKTGDLQRLAYLVGLFAGAVHPAAFMPVPVARWKGQLPKTVVQERVMAKVGKKVCRDLEVETHAWDAMGIGLWGLGRF